MKRNGHSLAVLIVLALLAAAQLAYYYPRLPDSIAVHFGPSGNPDAWSGKAGFIVLYGGIEALMFIMGLLAALLPSKMPVSMLNIPNRDYWLTPERREASLEFLSDQILWLESITLAFLIAVAQIIVRANLHGTPRIPHAPVFTVLAVFVASIIAVSVRMYWRFRRPIA